MKKVLVIGANGYLGSKLTNALSDEGIDVIAFVERRLPFDSIKKSHHVIIQDFKLDKIDEFENGDMMSDVDTLYHLAWSGVNAKLRNEAEIQIQNIMYGLKVLEFADKYHIKRVIVPGSAAEMGCINGVIHGIEPPFPSDMYSASKVATRYICQTFARLHDIELIWTLITSIYGPGRNDNNLLTYVIKSLIKGESPHTTWLEQKWDYLYVDDLIRALLLIGKKGKGGKIYPIGSGISMMMKQYVDIIHNIINPNVPIGMGDIPYKNPDKIDNQVLDIKDLTADTGFTPKMSFTEGIKRVINYYKIKEGQ